MLIIAGLAVAAYIANVVLSQRGRRIIDAHLHIQGSTEQAETFDFAITLFKDESEGTRQEKIAKYCEVIEARRKFNNDRQTAEYQARMELVESKKLELAGKAE